MVTKFKNDNEYELYCMLINTILWRLNELVAGPTRHVTSSSQTAMTRQVFILVLCFNRFASIIHERRINFLKLSTVGISIIWQP